MIEEEEEKKKKKASHRIGFCQPVDEDFDCDYSAISSLFDGACVYYEEPYLDSTWFKSHTLYPYHLRKASIYEGRHTG